MKPLTEVAKDIDFLRINILVHSILYYRFDDSLVSDDVWDSWARRLVYLQESYPEIADDCVYAYWFRYFDEHIAYELPLWDGWATAQALRLLRRRDEMQLAEFKRRKNNE